MVRPRLGLRKAQSLEVSTTIYTVGSLLLFNMALRALVVALG